MTTTPTQQTERIDSFIRKHLTESKSEAGISASETAKGAARHGFTGSANVRYAAFLEAFRSDPARSADYAERYPDCQFLPWAAFHSIRTALKLWCDLPEFYAGAVPAEQLPWMDLFTLEDGDEPVNHDACDMAQLSGNHRRVIEALFPPPQNWERPDWNPENSRLGVMYESSQPQQVNLLRGMYRMFKKSFFVMAPEDAFTTFEDFISRFQKCVQAVTEATLAPNDPLVVKPCKGGVLVVAAWGDEAAFLNDAVKELNL